MSSTSPTQIHCNVVVFFNNGVNPSRPWWVGLKEGRAIIATFGAFAGAPAAIVCALKLRRKLNTLLIVPAWLTALAKALEQETDPNDFAGMLELVRKGKYNFNRMDETTLTAIEEEIIGWDFSRHPFLY